VEHDRKIELNLAKPDAEGVAALHKKLTGKDMTEAELARLASALGPEAVPLEGGSSLPGKLNGRHFLTHPTGPSHRPWNGPTTPWECVCLHVEPPTSQ
jgi:hypothetical protein